MNRRAFLKMLGAGVAVAATLRLSDLPKLAERSSFPVGWVITDEEIEDGLYQEMSERYAQALAKSMLHTKEHVSARIYDSAFGAGP